jgi:hypothetical protein
MCCVNYSIQMRYWINFLDNNLLKSTIIIKIKGNIFVWLRINNPNSIIFDFNKTK